MALLKTEATSIAKRPMLPALPTLYQEEPIQFSPQDVAKIIEQIVAKGVKYAQLRKSLTSQEAENLPDRLQKSSFVKVMVRKIVIKMGEERRLGNGLRGFSRLLLEQIENQCWPLILIEKSLLQLSRQEQAQLSTLTTLLSSSAYMQRGDDNGIIYE